MDIIIKGTVQNDDGDAVEIIITDGDIQELIEAKARDRGVKPKQGKIAMWYSPEIISVTVKD